MVGGLEVVGGLEIVEGLEVRGGRGVGDSRGVGGGRGLEVVGGLVGGLEVVEVGLEVVGGDKWRW